MNTYDAATGNRTHNPLLARVALRPLDYTGLWYMGWNNDTSIGGHNANFNDGCNGDCAITDMLNFKNDDITHVYAYMPIFLFDLDPPL